MKMGKIVDELQEKEGVAVDRLEVWHNEENMKKLEEIDKDLCGGVPFFYNTQSGKWICGEADYEQLKGWASGN